MKKIYFSLVLLMCISISFAQNNDFNNGAADGGLWTSPANWTLGITPTSAHTVRTANSATSFVNANFTIFRLQNIFGTTGDRFVNSSSGGILTIRQTANEQIAIQNVSSTGVKLGLRGNVNINNSAGGFSDLAMANSAANSIEFESTSTLTLTTPLEVAGGSSNNFLFNGKLTGSGNLRIAVGASATFGNSVSNSGYTGELVLQSNSSLVVNTADDIIFYDGPKLQINGNASVTLNGANVLNSNIVVGGTNTFDLNVNKNQSSMSGIIMQGAGTLNMAIDNTVTNVSFADNSGSSWDAGAIINITGFVDGVVRFGTNDDGLTANQLSQIRINGTNSPVILDANGYLVNLSLSVNDLEKSELKPIAYPTLTSDKLYFSTPQKDVKIINLNGQILQHKTYNNQSEISVDFLSAGLYLIVFDNQKVEKFLKK